MKVVLFCGGQGMRIREYTDEVPKPMIHIGYRPILWHVMKYYAHFGYDDFILCLGHQADVIKNYFLNYNECISNDFVLSKGGQELDLLTSDIHDWTITFVDTGLHASIGERLMAVREHLAGEEAFMANYADCVTDLHLPDMVDYFHTHDKVGCFMGIRPNYTFHVIDMEENGTVQGLTEAKQTGMWVNGGFFIFKQELFDYMEPGDELVEAPFRRMIQQQQLVAYNYDGFWACMDTFKEKQLLERIHARGDAPWTVWESETHTPAKTPSSNGKDLRTYRPGAYSPSVPPVGA